MRRSAGMAHLAGEETPPPPGFASPVAALAALTSSLSSEKETLTKATDSDERAKLDQEKAELENQLLNINEKVAIRDNDLRERESLQSNYVIISKQITEKRKEFVNRILQNGKVKINIHMARMVFLLLF